MNNPENPYTTVELSAGRRIMINMLNLGGPRHVMYGLLEIDVTVPRAFIDNYKVRTGETLSFTGYVTYCLAHAIDEDKTVQAYLKGRRHLAIFENVDVGLMVERKVGEQRKLMGHVVRAANQKTFAEIHHEIRTVQSTPVPENRGMPNWFRVGMLLPWPLSKLFSRGFEWVMSRNPSIGVQMGGTVGVSAVGMFGEGISGWGIFPSTQVVGLVVGSIVQKPAVVDGQIEPRQMLNLTVSVDHNVIDGAPATRFVRRLVELIESGYGLDADEQTPAIREAVID